MRTIMSCILYESVPFNERVTSFKLNSDSIENFSSKSSRFPTNKNKLISNSYFIQMILNPAMFNQCKQTKFVTEVQMIAQHKFKLVENVFYENYSKISQSLTYSTLSVFMSSMSVSVILASILLLRYKFQSFLVQLQQSLLSVSRMV